MLIKSVMKFLNNNKRVALSILVFIVVFSLLGLPFTKWSIRGDDYGNIFRSQAKSWGDIADFFVDGNTEMIIYDVNDAAKVNQHFLSAYYRPMLFVYTFVLNSLFGLNFYYYHLVMVAIHALIAVLLFNLFLMFSGYLLSFLAALYFAFHPTLEGWLGWLGGLQYHVQLLLFLLSLLLLKKYLDNKKIFYYLLSCFLFLISVFSGEPPIVMPFWLILALYFYDKYNSAKDVIFIKNLGRYLSISSGFWMVSIFYLLVKLYLYPFELSTQNFHYDPIWISFFNRLAVRSGDFVTYICDVFNLTWLHYTFAKFRIFKIVWISFFSTVFLWLFKNNKKKDFLVFFLFSILIFTWPSFLIKHCQRYLYLVLPFFILMVLCCIKFCKRRLSLSFQKISMVFLIFILLANGTFVMFKMKNREKVLHKIDSAYRELVTAVDVEKITVFNLPCTLFGSEFPKALWLYNSKNNSCADVIMYPSINDKKEYDEKKEFVVTWDYEKEGFVIIDNKVVGKNSDE